METLYDKVLSNNLNDNDKKQLQLIFEKYHKGIKKYEDKINEIKEKAKLPKEPVEKPPKEPKEPSKMGRPRIHNPEDLVQVKRDIARRHYFNNIEKRKEQKRAWAIANREMLNARATYYRNKKKLEKSMILEEPI